MASPVSVSRDVPIHRLEPHPLPDPTAAFQWSEIFYDGMTHKNTHSLSHLNTPVSRNNNHHLEENTTMGDTERRQSNAAWITTMWFSMNSPLVSQTGGRVGGGEEDEQRSRAWGNPCFVLFCCYCMLLAQQNRSVHMRCICFELQSSSRVLSSSNPSLLRHKTGCQISEMSGGWDIENQARKIPRRQKQSFSDESFSYVHTHKENIPLLHHKQGTASLPTVSSYLITGAWSHAICCILM